MRLSKSLILKAAIVFAALLITVLFAHHTLATRYRPYDDEGYFLLSLDHYLAGGHLYTQVFTQYGPFYFLAQAIPFQLAHLAVSHDTGRLVTFALWLLSAGLGAYFVYRISNNASLAAAAALAFALLARVLSSEPGHPQQIILPILILACCATLPRGTGRLNLLLLGALGAALTFTKINVGLFYFAALFHTLICAFPRERLRSAGLCAMLVYALASPLLLMRQNLFTWAAGFCLLATVSVASTFWIAARVAPPSSTPLRDAWLVLAGGSSAAMLILGLTLRQGMSLPTLLEGMVLAPLRQPKLFSISLEISRFSLALAIAATLCILALYLSRARSWPFPDWLDAIRCAAGFLAVTLLASFFHKSWAVLPLLPLGLLPLRGSRHADMLPRIFVTCLAATQFLQAYPVAGSQQAIASAPLLLWGFVCIHDGAPGLFKLIRRIGARANEAFLRESAVGGILMFAFAGIMLASSAALSPYAGRSSPLRGAASLRLSPDLATRYGALAAELHNNCETLFTLPGMGSLNYWSGVPTPNGINLTAWLRAFNLPQQQEILSRLQANTRACAVYNRELSEFWGGTAEDEQASVLARYMLHEMPVVSTRDGYEIHVHPDRKTPWIAAAATPALPGDGR